MKKIIETKFYSFSINLIRNENIYHFEIIANCIFDNTKSSITNLNFIISEIIEPIIKFEDYESTIIVNKYDGIKIYNETIKLFNDTEWINYLEIKLQEDKEAGEWD